MKTIADQVRAIGPWFHQIDLGGGIRTRDLAPTPGPQPLDHPWPRWEKIRRSIPEDLTGKRVLDIGCNDGFFAVQMAQRGAAAVVAMEVVPQCVERVEFVKNRLKLSALDPHVGSIYDLDLKQDRFDFVLMLAVFYHLVHPVLALEKLAALTNELYIETIANRDEENSTMLWGLSTAKCGYDGWIPTTRCVKDLLRFVGFETIEELTDADDIRPIYRACKSR